MTRVHPSSAFLLSVGILLGSFPLSALAAGIGSTYSKMIIPRISINRSSKDNGGSLSYTGAEYATHRPYKVDFDLLRASDQSHELEMPMLRNNDISDESKDSYFILASDPTLRSRRRRRRQTEPTQQQQQQQFPPQQQQQQQQQAPFQQLGVFQGPLPVQRQRPQYDNIHTKYPYPYPPTLDVGPPQPIQAVVPESGNAGGDTGLTTDPPSDISQTTLLPEAGQGVPADQQEQQDPAGNFPDSPLVQQQQQQQPEGNVGSVSTTTYNPVGMISSSPLPVEPSSSVPPPSEDPSSQQGGGDLPDSPGHFQDPDQPPVPPPRVQPDLAMQKRLREKEDEIRQLKSQLESANLQVVSYEQENSMVKDQFMRSEEANIKLRDRVLQLENTNQHLQEQNGQLQQVSTEQRQQINGLKSSLKESKDRLEEQQNQASPLVQESTKHRKEIEDFLIRIRKLDEENETCKKQVKLYQLKVNYIMEQQRQQQQQQQPQKPQPQKKKQPTTPTEQQQKPQQQQPQQQQLPISASDIIVHVDVDDDELDPELSRMDAEIAALQKSADEVAAAIQKLPQPENVASPVVATPPVAPDAVLKQENEFPGEAVQVDPQQTKHKQQQQPEQKIVATAEDVARAESASRNFSGSPTWEQPAGF